MLRVCPDIRCAAAKTVTTNYTKLVHLPMVDVLSTPLMNIYGLWPDHTAFPPSYTVTIIVCNSSWDVRWPISINSASEKICLVMHHHSTIAITTKAQLQ